jgi:hypothetical protein
MVLFSAADHLIEGQSGKNVWVFSLMFSRAVVGQRTANQKCFPHVVSSTSKEEKH